MEEQTCLDCKYSIIEDIWHSWMCKKNHTIKTDEDGFPITRCEDFEEGSH